jgi:hypothetical protein
MLLQIVPGSFGYDLGCSLPTFVIAIFIGTTGACVLYVCVERLTRKRKNAGSDRHRPG